MKKRGLGRSLDALLVGSTTAVAEHASPAEQQSEPYRLLSVDLLQSGKYQPRRDMSPDALTNLANSIRQQGIIQPIIVRLVRDGHYEIVAGERRWRAAKLAELTEVPVIVREIPDESAVAIALIENIQRENLNPLEEAMALQRLLDEFSMTHQQVAEAVGKSRASVTNLLRLLGLCPEVKMMLEHGDIEMGHARALLALSGDLQVEAAKTVVHKLLSVRETENLVRRLQLPESSAATRSVDPDVRRLQESLSQRLKLPVTIQHGAKGKGKVTIRYQDIADLEMLLACI